ncbi:coiled-coil domain-containing protein 57 isoform X2 [Dicentrarchus labrax]|uniref:coiled-coil domain-containing protein 57 isoform X2 n=1 Tax=Dicentrarchus labrax TaxID=13489 RepID=UPI0021F5EB5F|nr:coiled-coil domain-containing protein 57 isoform X2 [Dicentrarchus labrax]
MQSDRDSGLGDLEAQLASKEREWKELLAARVHQLESLLKKAQEECSSLRDGYQKLSEDFQFNLAILDERDRELERYDVITARAVNAERHRQEELNQLHMQVAKLEEQRARETEERQEEQCKSQHSAAQHRLQLDQLKRSMAGEIQRQTEEYERMKWDLQHKIQELEGELTLQRQEMTAAFDSELRQQEHEFNLKMDEMRAVVLSHDLKVKQLSKETEVHYQAQLQATEALKVSKEFCQQIETQLQHKEQEIKDLTADKDCRMNELEDELKCMETKLKNEEDNHIKKYEAVVQALKERDAQLEVRCQAHTEELQKAKKRIVKLQEDMEVLAAQVHCSQRTQQDAMEQKDKTIQRLHTEVETTRTGWDKYISQVSSEMVVKDTEVITLQERETKLKTELDRIKEEMEGYKQQLSAGLKRERALEQKRVQVELEWQRRCEDLKAELYLANEQLIQDLSNARDQAKAELKEKEQELQELTVLLRSVKTERDQAIQGFTPKVDSLASEEIRRLQEQNSTLRAVVTQMRKDMEGLSRLLPQPQPQASSLQPVRHQGGPATTSFTPKADTQTGPPAQSADISSTINPADYTQALEQEVSQLKARCRHLEEKLEGPIGLPSLAPEDLLPTVPHNTRLQYQGLKQGGLCLENRANTSALMRLEARVTHVIEQVQKNAQLREENLYLQQQQASGQMSVGLFEDVQGAKSNPRLLHTRLKQAASCIARLSREKQQLIEMGNRLRAQITTAGLEAVEPERDSSTEKLGEQHDRLSALEQLQYQLTSQELQYALRQRVCTLAEQLLPGTHNLGPATEGAANPWSQGHESADRPERSKNKENTPPLSQSVRSLDRGPQPRSGQSRSLLSSEESLRSLNQLWGILDHGLSPSIFSEGEGEPSRVEVAESGSAGVQMMVHGTSAPFRNQPPSELKQRRNPSTTPSNTAKTSRHGAQDRMSKIRNYNVKD